MHLKQYFEAARGRAKSLAIAINKRPSYLSQISSGYRKCPPDLAPLVESATNGEVTRKELRPDDWHLIWPELVGV